MAVYSQIGRPPLSPFYIYSHFSIVFKPKIFISAESISETLFILVAVLSMSHEYQFFMLTFHVLIL